MRTVGVEEEMLLVDVRSGRPRAVSGQMLGHAPRRRPESAGVGVHGAVAEEMQQQQIEARTAPVADLTALRAEVRRWRSEAVAAARKAGSGVAALATSPLPVRPVLTRSPRYDWLEDRYQLTAREHLTCGCHVHVSVESDEEGVGVLDRIRVWLPSLLALSANSPFWNGQDSGYASYRSQAFARWPSCGPTDRFGSAEAYHRLVRTMVLSSVILDPGMVYFDARLSQHYPTVEIRAADVCFSIDEAIVVAALCRGLVETAAASGRPARRRPTCRPRCSGSRRGKPDGKDSRGASSTGAPSCRGRAGRCSRRSSTTWGPPCRRLGISRWCTRGSPACASGATAPSASGP